MNASFVIAQMTLAKGVRAPKEFFPPPPSALSLHPSLASLPATGSSKALDTRAVIPENNRDGGIKYFEALKTMQGVLSGRFEWESSIEHDLNNTRDPSERMFLRDLLQAVQVIKGSELPIRARNTTIIQCLRGAVKSNFYQQNKARGNVHCLLVQSLCDAKFTKVCPSASFRELVGKAALSANPHALDGLEKINKKTVGQVTREINGHLHHASSEYSKGTLALLMQKACGEFGGKCWLKGDPGGTSNVPYLRSRFSVNDGAKEREIDFCRFGTPTIQAKGKTEVDPMLLCALDAMKDKGQNFLYVNHQKLEGLEGVRANAIAAIQETHENFHFLSIPLDGPIVDSMTNIGHPPCLIKQLIDLIELSYELGINGCRLPAGAGISSVEIRILLQHVHEDWFGSKETFTRQDLEAFWGIFNTTLKHYMSKKLDIDVMNSSCKDNKDRGGTLGTIDEAVRNVLLGGHDDPVRLRELVDNALAPFMIKLEHILDDPSKPNHHRLGYLVSVLNHIATLEPAQIARIRQSHSELCFAVTGQEMSPRPKVANVRTASNAAVVPVSASLPQPGFTESQTPQVVTTTTTPIVERPVLKISEPIPGCDEGDELMVPSDSEDEANGADSLNEQIRENHFY